MTIPTVPTSMVAHTVPLEQAAASPPDTEPLVEVVPPLPPEVVAAYITEVVPVLAAAGALQPVLPGYGTMEDRCAQLAVITSFFDQAPDVQPDSNRENTKPMLPSMVAHSVSPEQRAMADDNFAPFLTTVQVFTQESTPVVPRDVAQRLWKLAVMEAILKQLPQVEALSEESPRIFTSMIAHRVPLEHLPPSTVAAESPEEVLPILPAPDDDQDGPPAPAGPDELADEATPMLRTAMARKLAQLALMESIMGQVTAGNEKQSIATPPSLATRRIPPEQLESILGLIGPPEGVLPMMPADDGLLDESSTPVAGPVLPDTLVQNLAQLAVLEAVLGQVPAADAERDQPWPIPTSMVAHRVPVEPLIPPALEEVSPIVVADADDVDYNDETPASPETPPLVRTSVSSQLAQLAIIEAIVDETLDEQGRNRMV